MLGTRRRLDGKYHSVQIYYRDHKPVSELRVPGVLETKVHGVAQREKIEIQTVTINPRLENSRFEKLQ